ncbi:hypothetical protein GJAV_G00001720 [Gymnothorax javanicus]|nr:hypothetical protein GJAV_G00001720 [Gymnothorax javanicus]
MDRTPVSLHDKLHTISESSGTGRTPNEILPLANLSSLAGAGSRMHPGASGEFLLDDEDNSEEFFDVYTVSSQEYRKIAQGKRSTLEKHETEIPFLIEHIKKLYISHSVKEVKDYVSDVSGIISYLHFSKDAISSKEQSSNLDEFNRLEKELVNTSRRLDSVLSKFHDELQDNLQKGARIAQTNCQRNAKISVLEPSWCNNRGYHKTLKALCRNNGHYRTRNGEVVDLNYSLSEPMYRKDK